MSDNKPQNYKFHSTGQFRNACTYILNKVSFDGFDEDGNVKRKPNFVPPVVSYTGTVKLHGTNASIVLHEDGTISFHSKTNMLGYVKDNEFTLLSDNFEFAQTMCRRLEGVRKTLMWAVESCQSVYGEAIFPIKVSGEWAGCFHYNTPIRLADGSTEKIGVIVNNKLPVEVLSYNKTTNKVESKKIVNWFNNGTTEDWLNITYKRRGRGGKGLNLNVTPNHKIFIKENNQLTEKQAKDLKVGDTVFLSGKRLSHKARQFIKGSLLGDMSFGTKRTVVVGHSKDNQPHYIKFISNLLDGSIATKTSGYGSQMEVFSSTAYPEIEDMYEELCQGESKNPTEDYLEDLGVIGLAAWYMDDGSLIDQGNSRQPQCELHTLGFTITTNKVIAEWLTKRGYSCYTVDRSNKYNKPCSEIRFNTEGAMAFLEDIAPYILKDFNYKLPTYLWDVPKIDILKVYSEYEQPLVETVITSIEKGISFKDKSMKGKYDIEVEDNHNYFANNILVHNSGIQKGVGVSFINKKGFFVFGVKCGDTDQENKRGWLPLNMIKSVCSSDHSIYNIMQFKTFNVDIDFSNPKLVQNKLIEYTEQVESECPVAKQLGVTDYLVGEGIVWVPNDIDYCWDSGSWFKVKGEKHSASKVKKLASVDPEKLESIEKFVEYAVTQNRLEQGLQEVGLDQKLMGAFIGWINRDVNKEEGDTLESNNLTMKDVGKRCADVARAFYLKKLNEQM